MNNGVREEVTQQATKRGAYVKLSSSVLRDCEVHSIHGHRHDLLLMYYVYYVLLSSCHVYILINAHLIGQST